MSTQKVRRKLSSEFKAKVAHEAIKNGREPCHPYLRLWKTE